MAPEVIAQSMYGKEVDIWSLGVLLYEIHAGINYNLKPFSIDQKIDFPNHFS